MIPIALVNEISPVILAVSNLTGLRGSLSSSNSICNYALQCCRLAGFARHAVAEVVRVEPKVWKEGRICPAGDTEGEAKVEATGERRGGGMRQPRRGEDVAFFIVSARMAEEMTQARRRGAAREAGASRREAQRPKTSASCRDTAWTRSSLRTAASSLRAIAAVLLVARHDELALVRAYSK